MVFPEILDVSDFCVEKLDYYYIGLFKGTSTVNTFCHTESGTPHKLNYLHYLLYP